MAEFKRRTLTLSSGKQIKLYGNSIAIGRSLEIGEGSVPNIFAEAPNHAGEKPADKPINKISNPYQLTADELQDLADYNIQLWMDFKHSIRKYGPDNTKVFNQE